MQTQAKDAVPDPRQLRRAIYTGAIGSALEYYDFAIYGLAAALVFGHIFFPTLGTTGALLASFATYGAGFLARPFGGLFFGGIGDDQPALGFIFAFDATDQNAVVKRCECHLVTLP